MSREYPKARKSLHSGYNHNPDLPAQAGRIAIRHPGYPEADSLLLTLRGRDSKDGAIDFCLAHSSCAIIANNRFDGWLSKGQEPTAEKLTGIHLLLPGTYFFHVPGPDEDSDCSLHRYPIVSTFRAWTFPTLPLPSVWTTPSTSYDLLNNVCALSDDGYSLDKAHVIPDAESNWFYRNNMESYGQRWGDLAGSSVTRLLDDPGNTITLRTDIHRAWDDRRFTIVPKKFSANGEYCMVVHCFDPDERFSQRFHNAPLHSSVASMPREYILARLAWTLLHNAIGIFLLRRVARLLVVVEEDGTIVEKLLRPDECQKIASYRPRSESPRKRQREGTETGQNKRRKWSNSSDSGLGSTDQEPEIERGRTKYRVAHEFLDNSIRKNHDLG